MRRLLLAALIVGVAFIPTAASAQYCAYHPSDPGCPGANPYSSPQPTQYELYALQGGAATPVAGPFPSYGACSAAAMQSGYTPGITYVCRPL